MEYKLHSIGGSYLKIFRDNYGDCKIEMSDGGKKPFDFMVSPYELDDLHKFLGKFLLEVGI